MLKKQEVVDDLSVYVLNLSCLRDIQNKENEMWLGCVSKVVKICSGNVQWLFSILILQEINSFTSTKFWLFFVKFSRLEPRLPL